jgi:hypothetical protein
MSMSTYRATLLSRSPACRDRASRRSLSTLYAEAQRRYLESVSPYARRLFHQMEVPEVDKIEGLPPALPRPRPDPRSHRGLDGAAPYQDHPRARRRRLTDGVGRPFVRPIGLSSL